MYVKGIVCSDENTANTFSFNSILFQFWWGSSSLNWATTFRVCKARYIQYLLLYIHQMSRNMTLTREKCKYWCCVYSLFLLPPKVAKQQHKLKNKLSSFKSQDVQQIHSVFWQIISKHNDKSTYSLCMCIKLCMDFSPHKHCALAFTKHY